MPHDISCDPLIHHLNQTRSPRYQSSQFSRPLWLGGAAGSVVSGLKAAVKGLNESDGTPHTVDGAGRGGMSVS